MLGQIVIGGAIALFIAGAMLMALHASAIPIRDLFRTIRNGPITNDQRFTERRRRLGLVGALLCMVASLVLVVAFSMRLF